MRNESESSLRSLTNATVQSVPNPRQTQIWKNGLKQALTPPWCLNFFHQMIKAKGGGQKVF